jgi:lauroyl/myristoyl acyltransferase
MKSGGKLESDLVRNVEQINAAISATILAYPQQWVWMHRRWSRKPADKGFEKVPNIERIT